MKHANWTALTVIAALLAAAAGAFAAETGLPAAAKDAPRLASARPAPAPATVRPAPSEPVPGLFGACPGAPAERMADSIAEYYATGKLRIY